MFNYFDWNAATCTLHVALKLMAESFIDQWLFIGWQKSSSIGCMLSENNVSTIGCVDIPCCCFLAFFSLDVKLKAMLTCGCAMEKNKSSYTKCFCIYHFLFEWYFLIGWCLVLNFKLCVNEASVEICLYVFKNNHISVFLFRWWCIQLFHKLRWSIKKWF